MKRLFCLMLMSVFLLSLTACGSIKKEDLFEKTFQYEKEGFGGDFCIALHEDGTASYYEGLLSSHLGMGNWTLEGDILTITEPPVYDFQILNRFRVEKGVLIFVEEGSTNFLYLKIADGERFFQIEE